MQDSSIDVIINARADRYGQFRDMATLTQTLKSAVYMHCRTHEKRMAADQIEALDMIMHKVARICNGDPDYVDSWVDIAGYATLVADRLNKDENEN